MPGRLVGSPGQRFACKCLNVRIETASPDSAPPESVDDPAYSKVYVGDNGIVVKHNELTMRTRQRIAPVQGTNRYSRYTTLTCVLCDLSVYRIFQVVPADVEGKDGPIIPSEDWVEKETMKSANGWIEVNNDCLTGDAIVHAEADSNYSSLLSVVVPPAAPQISFLPEKAKGSFEEEEPAAEPPKYLSHIRALFPPPPFTPSHPAFLHLASIAEKRSQERREAAERYIAEIVQQKTVEIEQADAALRKEVDAVWRKFKESRRHAHDEHANHHHNPHHTPLSPRASIARRSSSRSRERDTARTSFARNSSPSYGTPIAIRNFVPTSVSERKASSPPPRPSALSASLATSTFHHPRAQAERSSAPSNGRRGSPDSDSGSSKTMSTRSGSVTLVQPGPAESINVLQFRRNVDDTINTQATYRYFVIEEEMAKDQERRNQALKPEASMAAKDQEPAQSTASSSNANAKEQQNEKAPAEKTENPPTQQDSTAKPQEPPTPSRGRDAKGKRKVTFDVKPAVVTIKTEDSETSTPATPTELQDATRDMMFDLEDMDEDGTASHRPAQALPLLEQPSISRPARTVNGKAKMKGLPESFASLRPSSLPNPSHIRRPIRSAPGVDSSHSMMLSLPRAAGAASSRDAKVNGEKPPPSEEAEIDDAGEPRRLVTPTPFDHHQGAWSTDGRTWHTYTRHLPVTSSVILEEKETDEIDSQDDGHATIDTASTTPTGPSGSVQEKRRDSGRVVVETDDDDDDEESSPYGAYEAATIGVPGSLPVQIHLRNKPRESLSLASYQPQHAMPQPETQVPTKPNGKPMSSTAIRKAMYAERDRSRSVDPGVVMDLVVEEDEEEESEVENPEENAKLDELLSTTRGRKRALKILQRASQLPDAGMWRSLAS